ncbi:hypothetical protein VE02_09951 [Pseudogymnoascus sp. 03VT05]|nr:hypothetical protein VE02_09951 [Pseudogymnoascus sp. 03VT05]
MAKSVFQTGSCPTCRKSIFLIDGVFILGEAAKKGDRGEVKRQLEKGTPHSPRDLLDGTPLLRAAQHGHGDIVRLLLEGGTSPSDRDMYGQTALHLAVQSGFVNTVRVLIENGVPVSALDLKGSSALQIATANGDQEIIDLLRDTQLGETPINIMIMKSHDHGNEHHESASMRMANQWSRLSTHRTALINVPVTF